MKKKLLITVLFTIFSVCVCGQKTLIDGIWYYFDNVSKTATVTYDPCIDDDDPAYNGQFWTIEYDCDIITIPETVDYNGTTYTVTEIGAFAFKECGLRHVVMPSTLLNIDVEAFWGCLNLENVVIPNSVINIGGGAFGSISTLTSVSIGNSVKSIGDGAFRDCHALDVIIIPESVSCIGTDAFKGTPWLNNHQTYDGIIYAGKVAYGYRNSSLPSNSQITLRDDTKGIAGSAFKGLNDNYLTNFIIPNAVECIGDNAFYGCEGLTNISIPNSVRHIEEKAFAGCSGLTCINIPNSVTSIGYGAFQNCSDLTSIEVEAGNTQYDSREACNAIIETESNTLIAGCMNSTIPNSVTSIGQYAFSYCTGLEDIYALRTDPAAYDCATNAFSDYSARLHVPSGSKEAYASTQPWSNFASIVEEEDLTAIQPLTLTPSEAGQTYYNLQGQRIGRPQRGQLVVVRRADGSSRKMYVR